VPPEQKWPHKIFCTGCSISRKIARCFRRRSAIENQKPKTALPHERSSKRFRWMLLTRTLEKNSCLYRGGLITGGVYIGKGQEAVSGSVWLFCKKRDIFGAV